jgi:hypothetical protein
VNALQRIHRSLVPGGVLFDLQTALANAPVVNSAQGLGQDFDLIGRRLLAIEDEQVLLVMKIWRDSALT